MERIDIPESFAYQDTIGQTAWNNYTVSAVNFGFNGAPTLSAKYYTVGKLCHVQVRIQAGTALTTYAASSFVTLPISSQSYAGIATVNGVSSAIGLGTVVVSTAAVHMPTSANVTDYINIFAIYEI